MATTPLSIGDIAKEIEAYLPNPGQYQQNIHAAQIEPDGAVLLVTDTDQAFRLTITEAPVPDWARD